MEVINSFIGLYGYGISQPVNTFVLKTETFIGMVCIPPSGPMWATMIYYGIIDRLILYAAFQSAYSDVRYVCIHEWDWYPEYFWII